MGNYAGVSKTQVEMEVQVRLECHYGADLIHRYEFEWVKNKLVSVTCYRLDSVRDCEYCFCVVSFKNNMIHSVNDVAAVREYYANGKLRVEKWFLDDVLHRIDGPAVINYNEQGYVLRLRYYKYDVMSRVGLPADIKFNFDDHGTIRLSRVLWSVNGKRHSSVHPCYVSYHGNQVVRSKEYWFDDERFNGELPSVFDFNRSGGLESINYYSDDSILHSVKGKPSDVYYFQNGVVDMRCWRDHGAFHSVEHAAKEFYNEQGILLREEYCVKNKFFKTRQEWFQNDKVQEYYRKKKNKNSIITNISL